MQSPTDSTQPLTGDHTSEHDAAKHSDSDDMPAVSEVAMRIHLLGKLILPPDAR